MKAVGFRRHVYLPDRFRNLAKKTILIVFIVFSVLVFSPKPINAGGTTLSLSEGGKHEIGSIFSVNINIKTGGTTICAVRANLSFSPNHLEVVSLSPGPIYTMEPVKRYSNQAGTVSYSLAPSGGCTKEDTVLYQVVFKAKGSGTGEIKFTGTTVAAADPSGIAKAILVGLNNTSYVINGEENKEADPNPPDPNPNNSTLPPKNTTLSTQTVSAPSDLGTALVNDSGLVTPTLKTVSYDPGAEFDKPNKRSRGVNFYGTANPNVKVNISLGKNINFSATSDNNGNWKAFYNGWLTDGVHILTAKSEKDGKFSSELITPFTLSSQSSQVVTGTKLPGILTTQSGNEVNRKISQKTLGIIIISTMILLLIILAIIYWWLKKKEEANFKSQKLINKGINHKGGI